MLDDIARFTGHILRLPEGTPARQALQIALKPVTIIIIMGIFKCYFSGEHIALSYKKKQRCEHRIRKNQQIKSTVHGAG